MLFKKNSYHRIHLEIAKNICNYRCMFCYLADRHDEVSQKIDFSYLNSILDFCKHNYVEEVFVQGGESTLFPEVYNFCESLVRETKSHLSMVTNGSLFNEAWAALYAQRGNDVNFSLNASQAEKYTRLCGGDFAVALANIKRFIALNNQNPEPRCIVQVSMVVCTETINDLAAFYDLAVDLGVHKVQFFPDISSTYKINTEDPLFLERAHQALDILFARMRAHPAIECSTLTALARCLKYEKEIPAITSHKQLTARASSNNQKLIHYEKIPPQRKYKSCVHPWTSLFITDALDVYACCLALQQSWGNLKTTRLQKIIKNKKRYDFQKRFSQGDVSMCSNSCQLLYK